MTPALRAVGNTDGPGCVWYSRREMLDVRSAVRRRRCFTFKALEVAA